MSALKVIRGVVKDAKHATHTQTTTYGSGSHAQSNTTKTDYVDFWLDFEGRDVPVRARSNMPFLPGHSATFVMRDGIVIYMRNETAGRSHFVRSTMLRGETLVANGSLVLFVLGGFGLLPLGGGAPIAHILIPMLLNPFVAWGWSVWGWSVWGRRRVKAIVLALVRPA